jgi:hypothetical protein
MRRSHCFNCRNLVCAIFPLLFGFFGVLANAAPAQVGIITTYAGGGPNNVPALQANVAAPFGTAFDASGNFYILGNFLNVVLRVDHASSEVTIVAGNGTIGSYLGDGVAATSTAFNTSSLFGLAVDAAGDIFVADTYYNAIRRVDATTGIITTAAGDGGDCADDTDGLGDGCPAIYAILNQPVGLAMNSAGDLFYRGQGLRPRPPSGCRHGHNYDGGGRRIGMFRRNRLGRRWLPGY